MKNHTHETPVLVCIGSIRYRFLCGSGKGAVGTCRYEEYSTQYSSPSRKWPPTSLDLTNPVPMSIEEAGWIGWVVEELRRGREQDW